MDSQSATEPVRCATDWCGSTLTSRRKALWMYPPAKWRATPASRTRAASEAAKPAKSTNQIVSEASEKHGVDSDFIRSVIKQESAGNANAVSRAGARGLMQLMPGTALQLGVNDSFSPEQNVHGGAQYLRELLERYNGDAIKALAAYNAGPGAVDRYKGVPPYRETRQYVQRVVRDYNKSKQKRGSLPTNPPRNRQSHGRRIAAADAAIGGISESSSRRHF